MITELIRLNNTSYLIAGGTLAAILFVFWRFWCRDRIPFFGVFASGMLAAFYIAIVSMILFIQNDPCMIVVFKNIGLIEKNLALKKYVQSEYFKPGDEFCWYALETIDPTWQHAGHIDKEVLVAGVTAIRNLQINTKMLSGLDKVESGWRDTAEGEKILRALFERLPEFMNQRLKDQEYLKLLESLDLRPKEIIRYLEEKAWSQEVARAAGSILDKTDVKWRESEYGMRLGRTIVGRFSEGQDLTPDDRKQMLYYEDLSLHYKFLVEYLEAKRRSVEVAKKVVTVLNRIEPKWRDSEEGIQLGRSIVNRLSGTQNFTSEDSKQLEYFESLGLRHDVLISYLGEKNRGSEVGKRIAYSLDRIDYNWRASDAGVRLGNIIAVNLSAGEKLTENDRDQLIYFNSLGLKAHYLSQNSKLVNAKINQMAREDSQVRLRPEKMGATGRLAVDTAPAGARVELLNTQKPYQRGMELEAGSYSVRVSHPKLVSKTVRVEVKVGQESVIRISLDAISIGRLTIRSDPPGAQFDVGGRYTGTTPGEVKEIDEGNFRVTIRKEGYEDWTSQVEIKNGGWVELKPQLTLKAAIEKSPVIKDLFGAVTVKPGQPIHIAYWMAVAGPYSALGIDTRRGVEIAIADQGGKLLGYPIKLTGQDEGCNAPGGVAAATKIASDPTVVAAIGSNCSSAAGAGVPILWKAGIPSVSPSNTTPSFTDSKRGIEYGGYLRTSWSDKIQGIVAAEFAYKRLAVKKAATIHDGSVYAGTLQTVFADTFRKLGGEIVAQEAVNPTDTDMRVILSKISSKKPDFLYYPIFIAAGAQITRQARITAGLEKVYLMGADGTFSPDFYKAAGDSAIGMFHSSPDFSAMAPGYRDFLAKYIRKYGEKPMAPFHAHAYDAAKMVFNAIEKVAVKKMDGTLMIGRKTLRDALYATKGMRGITGIISCDSYGDCGEPHFGVYQQTADNIRKLTNPENPYWSFTK